MPENRFRSAAEAVAFAVGREAEAAATYARAAGLAKAPGLRELCLHLRDQELEHRRLLEGLGADEIGRLRPAPVADLGLVDRLADEKLAEDMTLQELLVFAARKEMEAAALYDALAASAGGDGLRDLFRFLAGQEREHKLKLEAEYERLILQEN